MQSRENELKDEVDHEKDVRSIMQSLTDLRNDGSAIKAQAVKWTKMPQEVKKKVLEKWEEKAREEGP